MTAVAERPVELLAGHRIISTTDIDQAREEVARVFCPHELSLTSRERDLDLRHNRLLLEDVGINFIDYGAQVHITPGVLNSFYLVQIPLAGGSVVTCDGVAQESHPGLATVPNATDHLDMVWLDDSPHLVVYLARSAVERRVEELLGRESSVPVRFRCAMPTDDPQVRGWRQLVDLLRTDAEQEGTTLHPAVRRQVEEAVVTGLLMVHPHNLTDCLERDVEPAAPRAVRRAMRACEESPEAHLTVAEMARQAGVSIRSLQEGFRRWVGLSPTEYLREVRLRRVRAELLDPPCAGITVAEVAHAWGFTHLGRFAGHYHARFGELPSETLGRRGGH